MLQDRIVTLTTPEEVQAFLTHYPTSVIFKAGTCHKTMQGFGFLQEQLQPRSDLRCGVIRVVEARAASNLVSELSGVIHHSPQVLLFKDGRAVFDVDNWSISPTTLEEGFRRVPPSGAMADTAAPRSDLTPYRQLLKQYLAGAIDDRQFEIAYTTTFRDDAELRSREEVEVLNSIFGDVDQHLAMHQMMAGRSDSALRQRAQVAYERLQALWDN